MIRKNIQLTEKQNEQLRKLAFNTRLSESEHIRMALEKYLKEASHMRVYDECEVNGKKFAILVNDETKEAMEAAYIDGHWDTDFSYPYIGVDPSDVAGSLDFDGCRKAGYRIVE